MEMMRSGVLELTVNVWPLLMTPSAPTLTVGRAPLKRYGGEKTCMSKWFVSQLHSAEGHGVSGAAIYQARVCGAPHCIHVQGQCVCLKFSTTVVHQSRACQLAEHAPAEAQK